MEQKKNESPLEKWLGLTQEYAKKCSELFSKATGLKNPTSPHQPKVETKHDFETCDELSFENVVDWIRSNMSKVKDSDGAILRRTKLIEDEDFKFKIEIFFLQGKNVLTNEIYKEIMCNSLEEDLESNFKDVNGQEVLIIK